MARIQIFDLHPTDCDLVFDKVECAAIIGGQSYGLAPVQIPGLVAPVPIFGYGVIGGQSYDVYNSIPLVGVTVDMLYEIANG